MMQAIRKQQKQSSSDGKESGVSEDRVKTI